MRDASYIERMSHHSTLHKRDEIIDKIGRLNQIVQIVFIQFMCYLDIEWFFLFTAHYEDGKCTYMKERMEGSASGKKYIMFVALIIWNVCCFIIKTVGI